MSSMYVTLTENCNWEGETWRFYIPLEGNQDALARLETALESFAEEEPETFELDLTPVPETEVDILVKHGGDATYMDSHNKLVGLLVIPDPKLAELAGGALEPLYKGEIREYMREETTADG